MITSRDEIRRARIRDPLILCSLFFLLTVVGFRVPGPLDIAPTAPEDSKRRGYSKRRVGPIGWVRTVSAETY